MTATNPAGQAQATSPPSPTITASTTGPLNTSPPTISGPAIEAQTLTAANGTWTGTPAPSFSYQWQRCDTRGANCSTIPSANSSTYTAVSADVGSTLTVVVKGSNVSGSASAAAAPTAVVTSAPGPVTSLLDDFNRANNSGPPGPNWTHMVVNSTAASNNLLITGQQVTGTAGSNADYWNAQQFGPGSEVWVTVATKPNVDNDPVVLGLRAQNPGLSTLSAYQMYYIYHSSGADQYKISVRTNGLTTTTVASATGPTLNPGDQLLFRAIGTTLELWRESSGIWSRILVGTDGTYQNAGYTFVTARDPAVLLDNFGGGTLP